MLIRYPGSKDRHKHLLPLVENAGSVITEPFCGTASVTFSLIEKGLATDVHLNDIDESIACLWLSVALYPKALIKLVNDYVPSPEDFYDFKTNSGGNDIEKAFRLIVLHQISYSGLGKKAGSPIGGKFQTGSYKVGCRWRPESLSKKITKCSQLLNSLDKLYITNDDWYEVFHPNRFLYIDPPYFKEGSNLYSYGFINHSELSDKLKSRSDWVLSYDDCTEVRDLYNWADIREVNYTSGLNGVSEHRRTELVILPLSPPMSDLTAAHGSGSISLGS